MPTKATFSLVQYVPDQVRDERVNVAVIMQVPTLNYAGIRVRPYMDRVLKVLWPEVDAELVRLMVRAMEDDIKPLEREPRDIAMRPFDIALVEKATPEYLERFTQVYGPLKLSAPRPVRIRDGMSFREMLDQLYGIYIRNEQLEREAHNITKDILQSQLVKELERRQIPYLPNMIIRGHYWPNKFDFGRARPDDTGKAIQIISFDNEKVDQPIFQCQRLIAAVHDVEEGSPRVRDKFDFGVALQAPIHYPQHGDEYESALRALRKDFVIFQSTDSADAMTAKVAEALANQGGLRAS